MPATRLLGKVMRKILGRPMLELQIERVLNARRATWIVVASQKIQKDDESDRFCDQEKLDCFCGSLDDVLDRYYKAAKAYQEKYIQTKLIFARRS